MKKFPASVAPFILIAALAMTSCSSSDAPQSKPASASEQAEQQPAEETPSVPDLTGDWVYVNPDSETDAMRASIVDGVITVRWDLQSAGITGIYWVGTFEAPSTADEPYTWTSQRDTAATDSELLAATSDTKDFTYEGDSIRFEVSIQGDTGSIEMKRA